MTARVAACHVHSEWSYDAEWTLEELATEFSNQGCEIVLMSEHDRGWDQQRWSVYKEACREASSDHLLMVPGIEYSDPRNAIHVLVWGSEDFLGEGLETPELLKRVCDAGAVAVLAHPERKRAWELFKPEWYQHLLGVEVWNRKTDGWAPSLRGIEAWQEHGMIPFASLDFHRKNQFYPLRMAFDMESACTEVAVFSALSRELISPVFKGNPLIPVLGKGGPIGSRPLEQVRRVLRRVIPH